MFRIRSTLGLLGGVLAVLAGGGGAAAAAVAVIDSGPSPDGKLPAGWQRGMNVTAFLPDAYAGPAAERALLTARSTGTRRVALVPTWYMTDVAADGVFAEPSKTPSDASLEAAAARAHELGLDVVLKPHVDVLDGTFRGEILPNDTGAWFDSYREMILPYADLAERIGAEAFVIGTELTSMSLYPDEWRSLIEEVRGRYSGKLTFAANWVDGAESVEFWDELDFIGIDAYMPLPTDSAEPTVDELLEAWGPYRARMASLHDRWRRKIVFTELGYQSRVGTAARIDQDSAPVDDEAQATAYEAAFTAMAPEPYFDGIWWWDWSAEGLADAGGWSAEGKPAEGVLYDWQGTGVAGGGDPAGP